MQTSFAPNAAGKPLLFGFSAWLSDLFTTQTAQPGVDEVRIDSARALQRLARELDNSQPNLAAELRNFAARS